MRLIAPDTRSDLLNRLQGPLDEAAWDEFHRLYHRALCDCLRQQVDLATAEEIAHVVLKDCAKNLGTFRREPGTGRFRGWLYSLVRARLMDHLRKTVSERNKLQALAAERAVQGTAVDGLVDLEARWNEEWEIWLTRLALRQLSESRRLDTKAHGILSQFFIGHRTKAEIVKLLRCRTKDVQNALDRWKEPLAETIHAIRVQLGDLGSH